MKAMYVSEIMEEVGGQLIRGDENAVVTGVSTDSRTAVPGDAFFALTERRDGHEFLTMAADAGCSLLIISKEEALPRSYDGAVLLTADPLRAFQDLAAAYLRSIRPVTVAVTGSVGKTSVKDMVAWVCRDSYRTVWSRKNYNNHIGVPMTIFEADDDTEVLILEMGMNHAGEIHRLAEIARPHIGIISNVGLSHRENFDDDDGIFHAKMEIADFMGTSDLLVVNGDDPRLAGAAADSRYPCKMITVGEGEGNDFRVSAIRYTESGALSFLLENEDEVERFLLPVAGAYNGVNAGLAVAALSRLHVGMSKAARRLREMERTPQRLEVKQGTDFLVIDDSYNASPDSMRSGMEYLMSLPGKRHIAILADMHELGPASPAHHRAVGEFAVTAGVDLLIAVGEKAADIAAGARTARGGAGQDADDSRLRHFAAKKEALAFLRGFPRQDDVFLVKGSRAEQMEDVVNYLLGEAPMRGNT